MIHKIIGALCLVLLAGCADVAEEPQSTRGKIALSFDDAPRGNGPQLTGAERGVALLQSLEAADSPPVVFFVTTRGFAFEEARRRVAAYADAGHLIANHSHTHPWASRVGLEAVIAEIDQAEANLEGFANRRPWFRFPYLDEGKTEELRDGIRSALDERSLFNGYVTVDNYDWYLEDKWKKAVRSGRTVDDDALKTAYVDMLIGAVDFYDGLAVDAFEETAPHVLLLHENDLAALYVDDLILALRDEGWEIISPDEAYAHSVAAIQPKTLRTRSGHFAALAIEAGREPKTIDNMAINEPELDAFLEARKVFGPAQ